MNTPLLVLKNAVKAFEKSDCLYCLIGGHAASLYRTQERFTRDVDFALIANNPSDSGKLARKIIKDLGMQPVVGFIPPTPQEGDRRSVCMVTSKPPSNGQKGIIDILLPVLPWIENAVRRAQHNKMDLGFARVPVITPEDLIIAKCYALRNSPDRFQDLDDLKEIFQSVKSLRKNYIKEELSKHNLAIPEQITKYTGKM